MWTLGINNMHDASAVLVKDGCIVAAVEEERFVRKKHVSGFPKEAIAYCLKEGGISIREVEAVGVSWRYWVLGHRVKCAMKSAAESMMSFRAKASRGAGQMTQEWYQLVRLRHLLESNFGKGPFHLFHLDHHLCHQVSAFYPSPFERAAILTMDGAGEEASTVFSLGEGTKIHEIKRINLPHSLGQFYAALTAFLGFRVQSDEYKVMGMAPYGIPRYAEFLRDQVLRPKSEGEFELNTGMLDYHAARSGHFVSRLTETLGPPRQNNESVEQRHMDIAASAQAVIEQQIIASARWLHEQTRAKALCIAGGVGLNCVANGKILEATPFEQIYVQPASGDAGTALGAALHLAHEVGKIGRRDVMDHAYWGPQFSDEEAEAAAVAAGLPFRRLTDETLNEDVSLALANGKLVFWFQGRMEWGPRALGNRSLLADPRRAEMRELINVKVKRREEFRPFAPAILAEAASEYLVCEHPSPFMTFAFKVHADKVPFVQATTHVDLTARPQTVTEHTNPKFWRLLKAFARRTGVPVLLNTSFNVQEPIVCTPEQAVSCFLRTDVDLLVMNNVLVHRREQ
ncbi:MAG: carbamoyltransferase C-terminal domain-containing protein [Nitrospira sp.]